MNRNLILKKMENTNWAYALNDESNTVQEFQDRICRTARLGTSLISYSNLVSGVPLQFSNVNDGKPFFIEKNRHPLN